MLRSVLVVALLFSLVAAAAADSAAEIGKRLAFERGKGNCLACHRIADGELPGTLGPPLLAMKQRYPDRAVLQQQICDATISNPDTRMPPFCRHGILSEEEVGLIVDYLYTL